MIAALAGLAPHLAEVERDRVGRLDLSGLVIETMQMDVKATMMDQALPVEGAAVKSASWPCTRSVKRRIFLPSRMSG